METIKTMFKSLRYHIHNLATGAVLQVPADEVCGNTIRNYASSAAAQYDRKYSVHFDRDARTYTITRTR